MSSNRAIQSHPNLYLQIPLNSISSEIQTRVTMVTIQSVSSASVDGAGSLEELTVFGEFVIFVRSMFVHDVCREIVTLKMTFTVKIVFVMFTSEKAFFC